MEEEEDLMEEAEGPTGEEAHTVGAAADGMIKGEKAGVMSATGIGDLYP